MSATAPHHSPDPVSAADAVSQAGHDAPPLLEVDDVVVEYHSGRKQAFAAVASVTFAVRAGETLGVVGESGCGKSSLARAIVQAPPPTRGTVRFDGTPLGELTDEELRRIRPRLQMIFQDPISSLNPRRTARQLVAEGPRIWRRPDSGGQVDDTLRLVGLDPDRQGDRRPHEFSGGQCQRLSIGRAIALEPDLLVCDEPVSALDVSVQAQILNLLRRLKRELNLTMIFIAHDLAVVKNISDRVAVMYLGRVCEIGDVNAIFSQPAHHYTSALLAAVPGTDDRASDEPGAGLAGEVPSPAHPPAGCRFHTRCPAAQERCAVDEPQLTPVVGDDDHHVACHFPLALTTAATHAG